MIVILCFTFLLNNCNSPPSNIFELPYQSSILAAVLSKNSVDSITLNLTNILPSVLKPNLLGLTPAASLLHRVATL